MTAIIVVMMILIAVCFYCLGFIAKELAYYRIMLMRQKRKEQNYTDKNH